MLLEAVYHRPKQNWSYAYDERTVHIRIRTKRKDMEHVELINFDKYKMKETLTTYPMAKLASDARFDYWEVAVQPPYRRLQYGFRLESGKKKVWLTERGFYNGQPEVPTGWFEFPFLNPADVFRPPAWVKDAVFYQIFPERFANGDLSNDPEDVQPWGGKPEWYNFFGGDLQGVINHLDHLSELGVNAIYFTPVFEATTNHKYDTRNYMKVDPHFGTNEKLKELVDLCHERGIRVVLDAVFNHAGGTFAPFLDVKEKGEKSEYKDWFYVREYPLEVKDGIPTYDTFAFEPIMPKLNTANSDVKEYLLKVARYWIEEIGVDGWRLDVANEVDHQFWREFRQTVKSVNPDAYILGEIWHDSMPWLQGDQFDAVMNYPFTNAVLDFMSGRMDGKQFAHEIGAITASYPRQVMEAAFNLLDSHDTARLLTIMEQDKRLMKQAALFQFTFMGTPCIYYGDEIGLEGANDPDCRKCMEWDPERQDQELFSFYQRLIALRKQYSALRTGELRFLYAKREDRRLAYERKDEQGRFVIVMNGSEQARKLSLRLSEGMYREVWNGQVIAAKREEKTKLELPAFGTLVLEEV